MKRTRVKVNPDQFPAVFRPLLTAPVYDSSCSPEARVWYLEAEDGLFLKTAPAGSLCKEAEMNRFFHQKGLGPEVLAYERLEQDWLLTRRIPGEDCVHGMYLAEPARLAETIGILLRQLHELPVDGCPVCRTETFLADAEENHRLGRYEESLFPDNWGFASPEEAWAVVQAVKVSLRADTLLHGDYCLPNILLDNWRFRGFVDLGSGGRGDRHIDLFWGSWTLVYNLKTEKWCDRFLDAYGRELVDPELLRAIAAFEVFL